MIFRKDIKEEIKKNTSLVKNIRLEYSSKELATMIDVKKSAYEMALENVKWCFDNFQTICVSTSGGKDSSVLFDMCLKEARSRGREIHLFYADEEFELSSSVEIVKWQMEQEGVIPHWYCPKIKMDNAYNKQKPFVTIWEEGREWFHTPPSYAIFDNLGQETFGNFLEEFNRLMIKKYDSCISLIGMTSYEGLKRLKALKLNSFYFGKSWISNLHKGFISGSPLEAMQIKDIWIYIALNGLKVNDYYAKSIPYVRDFRSVRVSSLLHEQTITSKEFLQNIYPHDYEKMERMVGGINATFDLMKIRTRKPSAIPTYYEYMLFLIEAVENKRKSVWLHHFVRNLRGIARESIENKVEISAYSICMRIFTGDIKGESYANNLVTAKRQYKKMRGIK